jgi:hypothetical protein
LAKLAALVVVALAAFFVLHGRGRATAAGVADCLKNAGATVTETRFLEDAFFGGQDVPPELQSRLQKVQGGNYDVELADDEGLLMVVEKGTQLEQVQQALSLAGGLGIAQGSGRVVMWWYGQPSTSSQATLTRCL